MNNGDYNEEGQQQKGQFHIDEEGESREQRSAENIRVQTVKATTDGGENAAVTVSRARRTIMLLWYRQGAI